MNIIRIIKKNQKYIPLPYAIKLNIYRLLLNLYRLFIVFRQKKEQNLEIDVDINFFKNKKFPRLEKNPLVSIVIPIYGKLKYTLRCLHSIIENQPSCSYEVIIVDDCSPDNSFEVLSQIPGLKLVRNFQNIGFVASCNNGAEVSRGKYLYFLNNDTLLLPEAINELVSTFNNFSKAGLVGSKLIYSNGELQEAGGVVWSDGSAWNYGKFKNCDDPEYAYARKVDYCSGASLMIPKALFFEVGGFANEYSPAYYEDVDLAFKVRRLGLEVIYQPLSRVIHYEGVTSGIDENKGIKKYQNINREKFYSIWKDELQSHYENGANIDKSIKRYYAGSLLIIDNTTPTPDQDAGSLVQLHVIKMMLDFGFHITFIPSHNLAHFGKYSCNLQKIGVKVLYYPYIKNILDFIEGSTKFDIVFLYRPDNGKLIHHIRRHQIKAKIIYYSVDLHYLRMQREADLSYSKKLLELSESMKDLEVDIISKADAAIIHSDEEIVKLKKIIPLANLQYFPLISDDNPTCNPFELRDGIAFIGGFNHAPNVDAVKFLIRDIMPIIYKSIPEIKLYIIGSNPPNEIKMLATENIIILGYLKDLREKFNDIKLTIAPLRFGAGAKGKIVTSLSLGVPVVSTLIGVEGMGITHGQGVLVGNTSDEIAEYAIKLLLDRCFWKTIRDEGINKSRNSWSPSVAKKIQSKVLASCGITIQ